MIKKSLYVWIAFLAVIMQRNDISAAISYNREYFQQQVDFKIKVRLDDDIHYLYGEWEMTYRNNSPDTLTFIYIHAWSNAYRTKTTAFASQMLNLGFTNFHFSDLSDIGGIKDIRFSDGTDTLNWEYYENNLDILRVNLNKPLHPGETMVLSTPFTVKIPDNFSRFGHKEQSYQISQWYLKPAVYDGNGWHPMPYLHFGEYYAEFGDYHVEITLPENYTVAATGVLQNEKERNRLLSMSDNYTAYNYKEYTEQQLMDFPPSSTEMKTLVYKAENVHDFAWFADKRFQVLYDTILIGESTIESWAFTLPNGSMLYKNMPSIIKRSVHFFSQKIGEYPFSQVSVVQAPVGAGGGMEYPMITAISQASDLYILERIVAHEICHNWFQGALGFNEREFPWLDEGLTTMYDGRYMGTHHPPDNFKEFPEWLYKDTLLTEQVLLFDFLHSKNTSISSCVPYDDLSKIEYYILAYEKPAMAFHYLMQYLGESRWDDCMRQFYATWKFKHPGPVDLQQSLEQCTGQSLDWMFSGLICHSEPIEFKTKIHQDQLYLKNNVVDQLPVRVRLMDASGGDTLFWVNTGLSFGEGIPIKPTTTKIVLDPEEYVWVKNRGDLTIHRIGLKNWRDINHPFITWGTRLEGRFKQGMYYLPIVGANAYDGLMTGIAIHNIGIPRGRFEYTLLPMWAFRSGGLSGQADFGYNQFFKGAKRFEIRYGLQFKSYHVNQVFGETLERMMRLVPSIEVQLPSNRSKGRYSTLLLRSIHIWEQSFSFNPSGGPPLNAGYRPTHIQEFRFIHTRNHVVRPFKWIVALERQTYTTGQVGINLRNEHYLKAWSSWQGAYQYEKGKYIKARFFAGSFIMNSRWELGLILDGTGRGHFSLFPNGALDYKYDEIFVGRLQTSGLGSQQVVRMDGGFRNAFTREFFDGITNRYLFSVNLISDLPQLPDWLPLKPYFDAGHTAVFVRTSSQSAFDENFFWSGGVALSLLQGLMEVNFPIINSKNIQRYYGERGSYFRRISFSWSLGRKRPGDIVRDLDFHLAF
jgi:hypothetical protein